MFIGQQQTASEAVPFRSSIRVSQPMGGRTSFSPFAHDGQGSYDRYHRGGKIGVPKITHSTAAGSDLGFLKPRSGHGSGLSAAGAQSFGGQVPPRGFGSSGSSAPPPPHRGLGTKTFGLSDGRRGLPVNHPPQWQKATERHQQPGYDQPRPAAQQRYPQQQWPLQQQHLQQHSSPAVRTSIRTSAFSGGGSGGRLSANSPFAVTAKPKPALKPPPVATGSQDWGGANRVYGADSASKAAIAPSASSSVMQSMGLPPHPTSPTARAQAAGGMWENEEQARERAAVFEAGYQRQAWHGTGTGGRSSTFVSNPPGGRSTIQLF